MNIRKITKGCLGAGLSSPGRGQKRFSSSKVWWAGLSFLLMLGLFPQIALAVNPVDRTVQVSATVSAAPASINLSWPADPNATQYTVARRLITDTTWGTGQNVAPSTNAYTDTNVVIGTSYEYQIVKTASGYNGYGYIYSGIKIPLVENRGTVVLVVDNTYASDLATELTRLGQDLVGDGWKVVRHDVNRSDSVPSVKALIKADYTADPAHVKAVFLFGHVPVPYSGLINPDGHPDHLGAWPADGFYGDMTGTWTDTSVNNSSAGRTQNRNIPGDGKYDQSFFPAPLKLQVGRADLANMPSFSKSERELLRQYLNKDHNFRQKLFTLPARGLIDDNFGDFGGEAFASSGWRNFAPLMGAANSAALDWFTTLNTQGYLWAYGAGGGSFTSAGGVGSTSNFAATDTKVVFTMLFGSYFGDWDSTDNFLRAPLATTSYGLTSSWAGRPQWYYHHMGLGETIGFSTLQTQNNTYSFPYPNSGFGTSYIHIALMGDPTLRLQPVTPPGPLTISPASGNSVNLSWAASTEAELGYNVYRATDPNGPFTRLTATPQASTTFTDPAPLFGLTNIYMVRAIKLQTSASGSYYNASEGVFGSSTPVCNALTVSRTVDDNNCGSLRYAVNFLINNPGSPNRVINMGLGVGSNTIQLGSDGLVLPPNITINGGPDAASSCPGGSPATILKGSGGSGFGLTLAGKTTLNGLKVEGFGGPQIKAGVANGSNVLHCVVATKS